MRLPPDGSNSFRIPGRFRPDPRRSWLLLIACLAFALGCKRESARPEAPAAQGHHGIRFLELSAHGADDKSPLLIAMHGRGDTAEGFSRIWRDFPGKLQIALSQAPIVFADGWSWFDWPPGSSDETLAENVSASEERLWKAIVERAHGRKVLVTGFSQGGVLSFVLAARHPDQIAYAFPIAGRSGGPLLPQPGQRTAPVYALHGAADNVIEVEFGRAAIAAFQKAGATAELKEFPGVGHTITPEMRDDLFAHIRAAMAP